MLVAVRALAPESDCERAVARRPHVQTRRCRDADGVVCAVEVKGRRDFALAKSEPVKETRNLATYCIGAIAVTRPPGDKIRRTIDPAECRDAHFHCVASLLESVVGKKF